MLWYAHKNKITLTVQKPFPSFHQQNAPPPPPPPPLSAVFIMDI